MSENRKLIEVVVTLLLAWSQKMRVELVTFFSAWHQLVQEEMETLHLKIKNKIMSKSLI